MNNSKFNRYMIEEIGRTTEGDLIINVGHSILPHTVFCTWLLP